MKNSIFFYTFLLCGHWVRAQNTGIGIATPLAKLHVYAGASGATPYSLAPLAVESNAHTYINLLAPVANESGILFGLPGNSAHGGIVYNNTSTGNGLQFRNNGNLTRMVINNNGAVGIGAVNPNASALLELSSTTRGFLPPRMNKAERDAINGGSPAPGLVVYCTDCTIPGPYSYNGTGWISMTSSATSTSTYVIGQAAHGGIVFWIDDTGSHGLVAAPADQNGGAFIVWATGSYTNTNATRDGIYGGAENTDRIINNLGNGNYACMVGVRYSGNGYGDWYLPSKGELHLMFQNIFAIGNFINLAYYWSSTEDMVAAGSTATSAWCEQAYTSGFGLQDNKTKGNQCRVRVIRRF